jgi:3-dehydroquinate synthase
VRAHFESSGLKTNLNGLSDDTWTTEKLIAHMNKDKKVIDGSIAFILAKSIGESFISRDVDMLDVKAVLERALNQF